MFYIVQVPGAVIQSFQNLCLCDTRAITYHFTIIHYHSPLSFSDNFTISQTLQYIYRSTARGFLFLAYPGEM
nr:MAG TPA: hypothetical protein [Inoviridae sp.]